MILPKLIDFIGQQKIVYVMTGLFCHNVTMSLTKVQKNTIREKNNSDTSGNLEGTSHFL